MQPEPIAFAVGSGVLSSRQRRPDPAPVTGRMRNLRLRIFPVTRYRNDLILYRATADGIEVLRVVHGARSMRRILRETE